jgi:bisphosphoglycerate-dependent phosphoglycerate mutase
MRRLILMRHAKAGWPAGVSTDFDRPLDDKGRQDAVAVGQWLVAEGYWPDLALCSASRRTSETLSLLHIPTDVKRIFTDRLYLAHRERLLAHIQGAEAHHCVVDRAQPRRERDCEPAAPCGPHSAIFGCHASWCYAGVSVRRGRLEECALA